MASSRNHTYHKPRQMRSEIANPAPRFDSRNHKMPQPLTDSKLRDLSCARYNPRSFLHPKPHYRTAPSCWLAHSYLQIHDRINSCPLLLSPVENQYRAHVIQPHLRYPITVKFVDFGRHQPIKSPLRLRIR